MLYVEWFDENSGEWRLSKMNVFKAVIVHLSGFGKIVPKKEIIFLKKK